MFSVKNDCMICEKATAVKYHCTSEANSSVKSEAKDFASFASLICHFSTLCPPQQTCTNLHTLFVHLYQSIYILNNCANNKYIYIGIQRQTKKNL